MINATNPSYEDVESEEKLWSADTISRLYESGLSITDIASKFDISITTVKGCLKRRQHKSRADLLKNRLERNE